MKEAQGATPRRVVAVIGGGFSGLLTAIHLLRLDPDLEIRFIERSAQFGSGKAFSAKSRMHLLNVRAANMSAFPDQPDHFLAWLSGSGAPEDFVSRGRYGEYLKSLLSQETSLPGRGGRLLLKQDEAIGVARSPHGWRVRLQSGHVIDADAVVLALGLPPPSAPAGASPSALASPAFVADPWARDLTRLPRGEVLLIGSGLTMIDVALSLATDGRRLTALSRRGLLPHSHAVVLPAQPPASALASPMAALKVLRAHARAVGWREAVDSIRPATAATWQGWSLDQRRRFLRHLQPWWDIHRHRMAPVVAERLAHLRRRGQFELLAGRLESLSLAGEAFNAVIRPRGADAPSARTFAAVVNCTSPQGNPERQEAGLLADMRRERLIRSDPLGLGLDVDDALRVIGACGRPEPGLFMAGPLTRGAFWETVAVPDLRRQTALAARSVVAYLENSASSRGLAVDLAPVRASGV